MRVRGVVLVAAGGVYLAGCLLLALGAGYGLVGLLLMSAAYGVAGAALFLPRRRRLRTLELLLILGLGLLFRLVIAFSCDSLPGVVEPAARSLTVVPERVAEQALPTPLLVRMMSSLLYFLGPEVWIGRVALMLLEVGLWALLLMMLEEERRPGAWMVLYVWNPVAVVASGVGAVGAATVLFLVFGLWALRKGRLERGMVALGLSAAGSYLLLPGFVALAVRPLGRRKALGTAVLAVIAGAVGLALWLAPGWGAVLRSGLFWETHNAGLFALLKWVTGSRWATWGLVGLLCGAAAYQFREAGATVVVDRMAKVALLVSPVVTAAGVHVLTPLLVLEPGLGWAAFYCAVAVVGMKFAGGQVPLVWLLVEYGVLVGGLAAERIWPLTRGEGPRQ